MNRRMVFLPLSVAISLVWVTLTATLLFAQARPLMIARTYPGATPCDTTLQACIDGSSAGDVIHIGAGTHTESVTLNKAVSLVGAGSETTILQAISGQRVMTVSGATIAQSTVISGMTFANGFRLNESGGGIYVTGGARPLLTDLVIANNRAVGGGGLASDGPLTLVNVSVLSNTAPMGSGGGVSIAGAVTLIGGRFENNTATYEGGGLYTTDALTLTGTQFISNAAPNGSGGGAFVGGAAALDGGCFERNYSGSFAGGLWVGQALALTGTQFANNIAPFSGGGAYANGASVLKGGRFEGNLSADNGGGLYANARLTLTGTQFISNTASDNGGGTFTNGRTQLSGGRFENNWSAVSGGGLFTADQLYAAETQFVGNAASVDGGGAYAAGQVGLAGVRLELNSAALRGGGLLSDSWLDLSGTQFISNQAQFGGGLYHSAIVDVEIANTLFAQNRVISDGAAIWLRADRIQLAHTTIADAQINPKQAIYVFGGTVHITNTIVARHVVGIQNEFGSITEDYNVFFDNASNIVGAVTSGGHSLSGNPAFANPASNDYHLTFGSAAIDTGTNAGVTSDFEGDPRPLDSGFDIGFDEWSRKFVYLPFIVK